MIVSGRDDTGPASTGGPGSIDAGREVELQCRAPVHWPQRVQHPAAIVIGQGTARPFDGKDTATSLNTPLSTTRQHALRSACASQATQRLPGAAACGSIENTYCSSNWAFETLRHAPAVYAGQAAVASSAVSKPASLTPEHVINLSVLCHPREKAGADRAIVPFCRLLSGPQSHPTPGQPAQSPPPPCYNRRPCRASRQRHCRHRRLSPGLQCKPARFADTWRASAGHRQVRQE